MKWAEVQPHPHEFAGSGDLEAGHAPAGRSHVVGPLTSDRKVVIVIVPIASRTDEGSVVGNGGKGRRQRERNGGEGRSRKENSIPLSAVFGALLLIGIDNLFS